MESELQKAIREYQEAHRAELDAAADLETITDEFAVARRRAMQSQTEAIDARERLIALIQKG